MDLTTVDDCRHDLGPGEHEAFYFVFTSSDGELHGFVRTLFDRQFTLELVALHASGRAWAHQQRAAHPPAHVPPDDSRLPFVERGDASGPTLKLACLEPWRAWRCQFQGALEALDGTTTLLADLDLEFTTINEPANYGYGSYKQAQQDGRLAGHVHLDTRTWTGELLCYRDHSWGQRPMGIADGWTIASAPGYFYLAVAQMAGQHMCLGRFTAAGGQSTPVRTLTITPLGDGWRIEDPQAGLAPWQAQRLAPPLVAYLGPAGQEALRDAPQPGDLYRDDIGPALFTAPDGRTATGFCEQAWRLA